MVLAEADLYRAIAEDEIRPAFQPLIELRTGQLSGFEVLARWHHRDLGEIVPDDFIPEFERSGLIDQLSRVLLEKAFAVPLFRERNLGLAINISPNQLLGSRLAERIAAVASKYIFPLDRLTIEITESALVDDLDRARAVACELKDLECKLALDDFGTGYSSLRNLHALPFDELKVDRSFVSSVTEKRESRKIVAAVLGLGHSLGLTTVAEGVETEEQANMLLWLGCELGQGWLYGHPAPAEDLPQVVAAIRPVESTVLPMFSGDGTLTSLAAQPSERLSQLQAVYDGAPVGLCFLDRKMRYVSLNRRLAQLNGVPAIDHIGKTVAEVIPHVFPMVEPFIRRALEGEPVIGVEVQKPSTHRGEGETLLLSYQPARDEGGEVLGVSVAIMDITGRKRTEAALKESEDHYRHMFELNPHVPWVLNEKGEVIEASPNWKSYTGQTDEEALGNGWAKMLHPDDVEPTLKAIEHTLKTGDPIDVEYRVSPPGGEWRWMRSRGAPRFLPSGKVVCIYGVVEEVHAQKQVSEELLHCQIELKTAVDSVPVGIALADTQDLRIYMVNPVAAGIFGGALFAGQTIAEASRLPLKRIDGSELRAEDFPLARTLLRGETVGAQRLSFKRSDGAEIPLDVSSKPVFASDGSLIGGLMMVSDLRGAG
jgi:PAS domain S-box-containing protein